MTCWHRLGERCECGHLTVPARFYWENEKEVSQEKAEAAFLEYLREHTPERYEKLVRDEIPVTNNVTELRQRFINEPLKVAGLGARGFASRRGRPKKHADQAARQKAYRGRQ